MALHNVVFKNNAFFSELKMLAVFVYGLFMSKRIGVAAIGRGMKTRTTARHNIKRWARFLKNEKIDVKKSMLTLQKILCSGVKRLLISIDWTTITNYGFQILKATVVADGRGIPIAFKTYKEGKIKNNQTLYEKEMIKYLRFIIHEGIEVIIIADRGFGMKSELAKYIDKIGFYYVLRSREAFFIEIDGNWKKIKNIKTKTDEIYELKNVTWPKFEKKVRGKKKERLQSRFVITKKKGFKVRWIIITNIYSLTASTIVKIYHKRMTIEETFRDEKNVLYGFAFEKMKLSSAERYDKMLLIISYAYFLTMLFGLFMEQKNMHRKMMANTVKYRSLSLFQVGFYYFKNYDIPIPKILALVNDLIYRL